MNYKMIKQWKDNGSTHPNSIEVELYDGNTFVKTITLDAAHNYAYSWKTEQVMNYSIKEKNVKGYKGIVSVSSNDAKIEYVITNTSTSSTGSHVKTGDTTRINHWVTLMALSGLFLLIVGTLFRYEKISQLLMTLGCICILVSCALFGYSLYRQNKEIRIYKYYIIKQNN